MKKMAGLPQIWILIGVFLVSRIITHLMGLRLNIWALTGYWQYLNIETLKHNLFNGIWYDHAQPPLFNLLLGIILKLGGTHSTLMFTFLLKMVTLVNAILLFTIIKKLVTVCWLPLLVSLLYILSPATLIFESELFYTTTVSLLLLISVLYLTRIVDYGSGWNAFGVILPLALLCLTRSIYHIIWLFMVISFLLFYFRKKAVLNNLILASLTGLILVGSWYVKNKIIFGKFTVSTWMGMNLAKNVFHDYEVKDSSRIAAYQPFSGIRVYRKFIDPGYENKFRGLNDLDLLQENKNDSSINEMEVSYIPVSDLYLEASLDHIKSHPVAYLQNVVQSSLLYFTPASAYSLGMEKANKLKYYDIFYSFNLNHFVYGKWERRVLITISAIPKLILYLFIFFVFIRYSIKNRSINPWNFFMLFTLGFAFGVGSFFEHYENMRFRFETEPLFLILAAQVFSRLYSRFQIRRSLSLRDLIA
jgi:hypothetical protein